MRKVLIIGPSFFYYNYSIGRAFEQLGFDYKIIQYDEPVHPFNLKNKLLNKVLKDKSVLQEKSRKSFNALLLDAYKTYSPELVFIYNGDIIELDTVHIFKQTAKVVVWMLDGVYRHPRSEALAPVVDAYFCFEQEDVNYLVNKGIKAYFLPQACDTSIYHPLNLKKDIDILFVGALYGYPNRIKLLQKVIERFPQYNIKIYGRYKPWYKNPLKWLLREKRNIFMNRNVSPEEVNRLYNRSKICLNIHHEQSKNGANPKVFEITGSGAFQLVDDNPYIKTIFKNEEVFIYHNEEELISFIDACLGSNVCEYSQSGYRSVSQNHTFVNRIKTVLEFVKL